MGDESVESYLLVTRQLAIMIHHDWQLIHHDVSQKKATRKSTSIEQQSLKPFEQLKNQS
jgi:hypothetical protein